MAIDGYKKRWMGCLKRRYSLKETKQWKYEKKIKIITRPMKFALQIEKLSKYKLMGPTTYVSNPQ